MYLGCVPLLIQLLHGSGPTAGGLFGSTRGCAAARVRAAQALRNIVTTNPDGRRSRREERVLQLLEQIRAYCNALTDDVDAEDVERQDNDLANVRQGQTVVTRQSQPAELLFIKRILPYGPGMSPTNTAASCEPIVQPRLRHRLFEVPQNLEKLHEKVREKNEQPY